MYTNSNDFFIINNLKKNLAIEKCTRTCLFGDDISKVEDSMHTISNISVYSMFIY
jgi:hypothetical protein